MSSNCTFMELKLMNPERPLASLKCSNCTFMELKLQTQQYLLQVLGVLIAPLWN